MKSVKLLTVIAALAAVVGTLAQVPSVINYQGRLSVGGSNVFTGPGQFKFALVDGGTNASRQATAWSNDGTSSAGSEPVGAIPLVVNQGLFAVNLGDTSLSNMTAVIPPSVFTNADVRLRIWFNDGVAGFQQFFPDQRLAAVPYALIAGNVPNAVLTAANLAPGAVGANALAPNAISAANIVDGAINADKLAPDVLSLKRISGGVMTSSGGNIGINTENPQSALQVVGTVTADAFQGDGAGLTNLAGLFKWQVVKRTAAQATPNTGYLADNQAQVTITLPPSPSLADVVRVAGMGLGGWQIVPNTGQSILSAETTNIVVQAGSNWTPHGPSTNWSSVASSADGTTLVAVVYGGQIYTSTDSGATWNPYESNRDWVSVASSADGTKLVAVVMNGQIYTSTDSGATWTPRENNRSWYSVASSTNGTKLVAGVNAGRIYTSTDSGATWSPRASQQYWRSVASSADGTKLVAVGYGGQIYTSTDSGATWTPHESNRNWWSVASSAGGTNLVAVVSGGQVYTSGNSGVTWTPHESNRNWWSVASSAGGTKLVAVVYGGQIYISTDSGATWTGHGPSANWISVASSSDGTKLVAVEQPGQIYTSTQVLAPGTITAGSLTGDMAGAVELQYIGSGLWRLLSHEGNLYSKGVPR